MGAEGLRGFPAEGEMGAGGLRGFREEGKIGAEGSRGFRAEGKIGAGGSRGDLAERGRGAEHRLAGSREMADETSALLTAAQPRKPSGGDELLAE
jgi:hypothetical protein